jgi:type VI protein secretion system component VasK
MSIWLFRALRWLLTLVYGLLLLAAVVIVGPEGPNGVPNVFSKAISILAVTAAYAILMLLLWLHERYPPQQQHRRLSDKNPRGVE